MSPPASTKTETCPQDPTTERAQFRIAAHGGGADVETVRKGNGSVKVEKLGHGESGRESICLGWDRG